MPNQILFGLLINPPDYDGIILVDFDLCNNALPIRNINLDKFLSGLYEEARRHLGLGTQRQWSDLEIARTTPLLLGLFSVVTLLAHHMQANFTWTTRQKIWYVKSLPTFSDALALVRRFFWASTFSISPKSIDIIKVPRPLLNRLRDIALYAA